MIIEFFGLPFSGKTTISTKLKNSFLNKKKISSYREIIFLHLYNIKQINFLEYKILKKIEYQREFGSDRYKENLFLKIIKIFFLIILNKKKIKKKIDEMFENCKNEYPEFLKFLNLKLNENSDKSIYLNFDWIKYLIIGHSLSSKYKNLILINSEGFFQICISLLIRTNMNFYDIKKFLSLCPDIDYVFVIISERKDKKRILNFIKKKNNKFLFDRKFIKKFFYMVKCIKALKNKNIFIGGKKSFNKIDETFYSNLDH
jgi:hypothetical protein